VVRTVLQLVSSGVIDLMDDIPISLNFSIADVREPNKRSTAFSKTITVAGSKNNNDLFKHIYKIDSYSNFNPKIRADVVLLQDGIPVIVGVMQLLNILVEENKILYEVTIIGDSGGFFQAIEGKELQELDMSEFDHTLTVPNIFDSWTTTKGSGYVYNLIDRGYTDHIDWPIENFIPSIYVREYIDKIFSAAGYSFTSTFFDSNYFKSLVIPYSGGRARVSDAIMANRFVEVSENIDTTVQLPSLFNVLVWDTIDSDSGNNFVDNTTYEAPRNGMYTFDGLIKISNNSSPIQIAVVSTFSVSPTVLFTSKLIASPQDITISISKVSLAKGDKVLVLISGNFSVTVGATSYLKIRSVNTGMFNGDTMFMNNTIPVKIKQQDFFMSLVKMHNLYISEDPQNSKNLLIETRNDYYSTSETIDWTDKVDRSQPISIKPLGELTARRYIFAYKPDRDYYNTLYQTAYDDETYGQRIFYTENEFLTNDIQTDVIFSNTPLIGKRTLNLGTVTHRMVFPSLISQKAQLAFTTNNPSSNIRILMYNGLKAAPVWFIVADGLRAPAPSQQGVYLYPFSGHINNLLTPTIDISFGAPKELYFDTLVYTNGNLYNTYYKQYIEEITDKDSKVITAKLLLTPTDISNLDFRKQYNIDGNLLRLNKITNYNPNRPSLCTAEFILIKESAAFAGSTISTNGGIDTTL